MNPDDGHAADLCYQAQAQLVSLLSGVSRSFDVLSEAVVASAPRVDDGMFGIAYGTFGGVAGSASQDGHTPGSGMSTITPPGTQQMGTQPATQTDNSTASSTQPGTQLGIRTSMSNTMTAVGGGPGGSRAMRQRASSTDTDRHRNLLSACCNLLCPQVSHPAAPGRAVSACAVKLQVVRFSQNIL